MHTKQAEAELFRLEEAASAIYRTSLRVSNIVGTDEAYRLLTRAARLLDEQADRIRAELKKVSNHQ